MMGYKKGRLTSKACGIGFLIRSNYPTECLLTVMKPPTSLQGRVGGILIQTPQLDTAAFGVYFAPVSEPKHAEIARHITAWLDSQIDTWARARISSSGGT
eukprot:5861290-Pyramimonas_sp.AAC.1